MNKRNLILLVIIYLLTSCVSTPVLVPYQIGEFSQSNEGKVSSVWALNAPLSSMTIEKVDDKTLPSREGRGRPYSVVLPPGKHKLSIYLHDVSNPNPWGGERYANVDIDVDLLAGHTYTLNRTSANGRLVRVYVQDLGMNKHCKYVTTDVGVQSGYVPVELECE